MNPPSATLAAVPHSAPGDRPRQASVPRIAPPPAPRVSGREAGQPVVLVAEDHADSREALRTLLEAFGYRVVEAVDGREAVERARAEHPDLVLMDVMMPRMDGLQATRAIRADPDLAGLRIVALTAVEGARATVLEAGCDELVPKPIDVRRLLERLPGWVGTAGRG
jgi:CheY-like chemotaxis protein